ncbi:MAG TPA: DUF4416 family protein [Spirochaetia bacterium]
MGTAAPFVPEKLVIAILCSRPACRGDLRDALVSRWGAIDYECEPFPFTWTRYYDAEMGGPIERSFVSFERLVDPSGLAGIKRETNRLEDDFRRAAGRTVNLDPGLMALSRFSLATTKENAHRIPLSDGIYAEITLLYARGGFRPLEWTYPDYRAEPTTGILGRIRELYKTQLSLRQ